MKLCVMVEKPSCMSDKNIQSSLCYLLRIRLVLLLVVVTSKLVVICFSESFK